MFKFILPLFISAFLISGCLNSDCQFEVNYDGDSPQLSADIDSIENFLNENNIQALEDPSGLRYIIHEEGTGATADLCDVISFTYTGRLLSDSTIIDQSNTPFRIGLYRLITGFQIGVPLIKEGGSITLFIPSTFGYAQDSTDNVPDNANLIFDVQLTEID